MYLHLRIHTYAMGWTDSAVRRYVRDAGDLLDELNELQRCDCTTRNERKARRAVSGGWTSSRPASPSCARRRSSQSIKPPLDGRQVMEFLGVEPGRVVGEALDFLLEARLDEGPITEADAYARLPRLVRRREGRGGSGPDLAGPPDDVGGGEGATAGVACGLGLADRVDLESRPAEAVNTSPIRYGPDGADGVVVEVRAGHVRTLERQTRPRVPGRSRPTRRTDAGA